MRIANIIISLTMLSVLVGCGNTKKLKALEEKLDQANVDIAALKKKLADQVPDHTKGAQSNENDPAEAELLKTLKQDYTNLLQIHQRRLNRGVEPELLFLLQPAFATNSETNKNAKLEILGAQLALAKKVEDIAVKRDKGGIEPPGTSTSARIVRVQLELARLELQQNNSK